MKNIGVISYNIYCNFTNYGSALQSWALCRTINSVDEKRYQAKLIDYCPDILLDKDPLNPFANMWDQDAESRRMCKLTLPAIRENYRKFENFYQTQFIKSKKKYTSQNFDEVVEDEDLCGFICGSDTIFCIDEFKGFDDGYYANYPCMKNGYTIAYGASFGDAHFDVSTYPVLNERIRNFKALGLREKAMLDYVGEHTSVPVQRTIDPTLLLTDKDYDMLAAERQEQKPYLLYYARRYDQGMEVYVENLAREKRLKIVEISLRAVNAQKGHRMFYEAGVEEFLSLVKYSEMVVTNSYHGLLLAVQYRRPVCVFTREQCGSKITEALELFGMEENMLVRGKEKTIPDINYEAVHSRIDLARKNSLAFLDIQLKKFPE